MLEPRSAAEWEVVLEQWLERPSMLSSRAMAEQIIAYAVQECAALQAALTEAQRLDFTGHDHPEANGQRPTLGAFKWTFSFTLEDARTLKVHVGERGFRAFEEMFLKNRDADYKERDALQRRVETLEKYADHLDDCDGADINSPRKCSCGLHAALRGGETG